MLRLPAQPDSDSRHVREAAGDVSCPEPRRRDEVPGPAAAWRYFDVDVSGLDARLDYFEHLGNDRCLAWTNGPTMRVLFTNGSD